jgi:hypothetical protein
MSPHGSCEVLRDNSRPDSSAYGQRQVERCRYAWTEGFGVGAWRLSWDAATQQLARLLCWAFVAVPWLRSHVDHDWTSVAEWLWGITGYHDAGFFAVLTRCLPSSFANFVSGALPAMSLAGISVE